MDLSAGSMISVRVSPKATALCRIDRTGGLCRSCGVDVIWVKTPAGKWMPVDPAEEGDEFVSHFATCPDAAGWRKKGASS